MAQRTRAGGWGGGMANMPAVMPDVMPAVMLGHIWAYLGRRQAGEKHLGARWAHMCRDMQRPAIHAMLMCSMRA